MILTNLTHNTDRKKLKNHLFNNDDRLILLYGSVLKTGELIFKLINVLVKVDERGIYFLSQIDENNKAVHDLLESSEVFNCDYYSFVGE